MDDWKIVAVLAIALLVVGVIAWFKRRKSIKSGLTTLRGDGSQHWD